MSRWDIWRDGFAATGDGRQPPARMHEGVEAETFREACVKAFAGDRHFTASPELAWWGCALHATEAECWDPTK